MTGAEEPNLISIIETPLDAEYGGKQELVAVGLPPEAEARNARLEMTIAAWLEAKFNRSNSAKTRKAYQETLGGFRAVLLESGLDLDLPNPTVIALVAQRWAGLSTNPAKAKENISPTTYNQRLAILSSFYNYARRQGLLEIENPISRVERRSVQSYADAHALDYNDLKINLAAIDRTDPVGQRDYALLSVALQTGRRLSELAALRRGDLKLDGASVIIYWRRTKGGKATSDRLPQALSRALADWLSTYYKQGLAGLPPGAPVWVSLSRRNEGQALGIQTIADICERRLGTSKVHSLRHTFARAMEDAGAKVSTIQARLGHTSLATTGRYLAALKQAENEHAEALSRLFGID